MCIYDTAPRTVTVAFRGLVFVGGKVYGNCAADSPCTVIDFQLEQPLYEKLKFAQQPVFKQTAAVKKELGNLADVASIPRNFRENARIIDILCSTEK